MITYDLHVHTCLSPDASDDMTPVKVIDTAIANGLDIIAITDHNALKNAKTAYEYMFDRAGEITFIPGIEVCSSEEVHVLCLFPDMSSALRMERIVDANMHDKKNKPKAFGHQYIMDEFDDVIKEDDRLLMFSTKMTVEEIFYATRQMNGVAVYAHMDSKNGSVLSILGTVPERPNPRGFEYTNTSCGKELAEMRRDTGKFNLFSSNAHSLNQINTKETSADLENFAEEIRDSNGKVSAAKFIKWLRSYEGI